MHPLTDRLHLAYELTDQAEGQLRTWEAAMAAEPTGSPIRWHFYLSRYLRSATVAGSTQIEGNPLSVDQVDALLQGEQIAAPERVRLEPINYNFALSSAQSLALSDSFEWSEAILRMLNGQILQGSPDDRQGRYRDGPVTVAGFYTPPDSRSISGLMRDLVVWLRESSDPILVRVALLHLNVVAIHPWFDGNGRTARVASAVELMRRNISAPEVVTIEPYLRQHQDEYFDQLRTTLGPSYEPDRHVASPWVNYYIRISADRLNFDQRMQDAWPHDMGTMLDALMGAGMPGDWGPVLLLTAIAPVRTRAVSQLVNRGMATTRAMFADMERSGWVEHRGRTRGRLYLPGPRLRALQLRTPDIVQRHIYGPTLGLVA